MIDTKTHNVRYLRTSYLVGGFLTLMVLVIMVITEGLQRGHTRQGDKVPSRQTGDSSFLPASYSGALELILFPDPRGGGGEAGLEKGLCVF